MWLILVGSGKLSRRAKELHLWPDRVDWPSTRWAIYPEWSTRLLWDTIVRTHQNDAEYLALRRRVRLGTLILIVAAPCIMALGLYSESTGPTRSGDATGLSRDVDAQATDKAGPFHDVTETSKKAGSTPMP